MTCDGRLRDAMIHVLLAEDFKCDSVSQGTFVD